MIEIVYIGSMRDDLGVQREREQLEWRADVTDVAALIEFLCAQRGVQWSAALQKENLLVSVNQAMVQTDHPLADGDEVIFFPPIAGG